MKSNTPFIPWVPVLLLLLLLAFPKLSIEGAQNGLLLWFQVLLPTLTPFIICTQLVVSMGGASLLVRPFYPVIHAFFGLSSAGSYVFLCGLLCGYPLGAKLCGDFSKNKMISPEEASYLLAICNHPSPMFLLGFVTSQLQISGFPWMVIICMYLPVPVLGWMARKVYQVNNTCERTSLSLKAPALSMETILLSTADTMVVIGGYVMLFSILALWTQHLTFLPSWIAALLSGMAEITTGVNLITKTIPPDLRTFMVIGVVAFGGCSGIFQTRSVIKNAGLSIRHYTLWKLLHMLLACIIFILLRMALPLG